MNVIFELLSVLCWIQVKYKPAVNYTSVSEFRNKVKGTPCQVSKLRLGVDSILVAAPHYTPEFMLDG
jgi:hypothetical protein